MNNQELWKALKEAIIKGADDVSKIISENKSRIKEIINESYEGKETLLEIAIKNSCSRDIIKIFIENGADIEQKTTRGRTVLFEVLVSNNIDIASVLFENSSSTIDLSNYLNDYIMNAPEKQWSIDSNVIEWLVENGADINKKDSRGKTVVEYAIFHRDTQTATYLLNYGAKYEDLEILRKYINYCEKIIVDKVRELLDEGKKLDINPKVIREAENNLSDSESFRITLWLKGSNTIKVMNSLQESNIMLRKEIFIHKKILEFERLSKLLREGKDLSDKQHELIDWNIVDISGNTLLHIAAKVHNSKAVRFLITKIDPNIQNNAGMTAADINKKYVSSTKATLREMEEDKILKSDKISEEGKEALEEVNKKRIASRETAKTEIEDLFQQSLSNSMRQKQDASIRI